MGPAILSPDRPGWSRAQFCLAAGFLVKTKPRKKRSAAASRHAWTVARIGPVSPRNRMRRKLRFRFRRAKRPNNCSSGYLLAFIGAGLTSVATSLAFGNFRELVAFFLAIVANHLDGFRKMAGMLGIDREACLAQRRRQRAEKPRWRRQPCSCPSWRTCRSNA